MLSQRFEEKLDRYQKMLSLTEGQKQAIESDDLEALKDILAEKEKLIREVNDIQLSLYSVKSLNDLNGLNDLSGSRKMMEDELPESEKIQLRYLISKASTTLQRISTLEKESERLFSQKHFDVKKNIENLCKGRKALRGYRSCISGKADPPRFISRNG